MDTCPICGASLISGVACPFNVPIEQAPWQFDYGLMAKGEMQHHEHQLMVARWNLHHKHELNSKVLQWSIDTIANFGGENIL
jgi:hypothetical protein